MPKMIGLINEDASIVTKKFVEDGLNKKQNSITGAASTITSSNLTSNRALVSNDSGKVSASTVTATELSYLKGTTSSIQNQLTDKANAVHTHDDRYYTESEVDAKLEENKVFIAIEGTTTYQEIVNARDAGRVVQAIDEYGVLHNLAVINENEDGFAVFTQTDGTVVLALLVTTDNQWQSVETPLPTAEEYYQKYQVDELLANKSDKNHNHDSAYDAKGAASTAEANAKAYADSAATTAANTVKNDLLNGAGGAYDTLKELGDLIDENKDALDALEEIANGKANASDLTSHINNKSNPHGISLSQLSVTATAAELNILDGATVTTEELNYVDGVTSNIQTQLDSKAPSAHNQSATTITSGTLDTARLPVVPTTKGGTGATTAAGALVNLGLTATAAEINKLDGATATTTEINYLSGVSSGIQAQLNSKQPTITGAATTITGDNLATSRALISNTSGKIAVSSVTSTELGYLSGVTSKIQDQLDGKSGTNHTHKYAGSSTAGGAANSANKLNTDAGGEINPVYFLNGVPTPTTYTLGANVPSDAKFTDTTYSDATQTVHGLMSINDKKKLDGIASGANAYVHPTYTARTGVPTGNATPSFGGTFQVSQPVSDGTGHITAINARTITIPSATASSTANGLMSKTDKSKLDAITASATEINYTTGVTSSIQNQLDDKVSLSTTNQQRLNGSLLLPNLIIGRASSSTNGLSFYSTDANKYLGNVYISERDDSTHQLTFLVKDNAFHNLYIQTEPITLTENKICSFVTTLTEDYQLMREHLTDTDDPHEVINMELITVDDIDTICGATIQMASDSGVVF